MPKTRDEAASARIEINAVAFKEGDAWVAQGIEYDIVAHASDVTILPQAFIRAVVENMAVTEHLGRKPLEGVKAAPEHFRSMYEQAKNVLRPIEKQKAWLEVAIRL